MAAICICFHCRPGGGASRVFINKLIKSRGGAGADNAAEIIIEQCGYIELTESSQPAAAALATGVVQAKQILSQHETLTQARNCLKELCGRF